MDLILLTIITALTFADGQDDTTFYATTALPTVQMKDIIKSTKPTISNTNSTNELIKAQPWQKAIANIGENLIAGEKYFQYTQAQLVSWEPPEFFRKNYPYYLSGFDDENRPIWIAEVGHWDFRALVEQGQEHLLDMSTEAAILESFKIFRARSTPENPVNKVIFIFDADDFSMRQISSPKTVAFFLKFTRRYRAFMEKYLHVGYLINVNYVAQTLLNILRPVLGNLMEKIEVYGTNKGKWIPQLRRNLPHDQIPHWYGGLENHKPVRVYG